MGKERKKVHAEAGRPQISFACECVDLDLGRPTNCTSSMEPAIINHSVCLSDRRRDPTF